MNNFFASVELLDHPELRDKPVAVCGNPENRHGIILAKNQIAKAAGVQTAETIWQAKKKCPDLQFLPAHHDKYTKYFHIINEIYYRYTDMVEPFSIDESWLDVTGSQKLFGTGVEMADSIRETVKKELGLTLSAGVSYNKVFAKMGSEYKKPDATTLISRENYKEILWPQPIRNLFFVGRATAQKLNTIGIATIGDAANAEPAALKRLLGKQGEQVYKYANGLDDAPVIRDCERKKIQSVGDGITFKRDLLGTADIRLALTALCDIVSARLRRYGLKAGGIKLDVKDPNFRVVSKQKRLDFPINSMEEMADESYRLLVTFWDIEKPIRMLTVTGFNLSDENEAVQLSLFAEKNERHERADKIEKTVDEIRRRFGSDAIGYGSFIGNDIGLSFKIEDTDE